MTNGEHHVTSPDATSQTTPPAGEDRQTSSVYDNASLGELFSRLTNDMSVLFRQEVQLAKTELRSEAKAAGKAGALLAAAAVLAWIMLMLLSWAAAWGLAEVMPAGFAFLIVGVIFGVVAAVLGAAGKKRLQSIEPRPEATIDTLQKDKQVLSEGMKR